MKRKRYSEQQIAFTLRQHETGTTVTAMLEVCALGGLICLE
jgi:hypothetical protein